MSSNSPSHSSALVHRRLLYDCSALKVKLVRGDTLPGPGFTAALTATDKVGAGDSHRGAVAAALVEALRSPDAANRDYSETSNSVGLSRNSVGCSVCVRWEAL